MPDSGLFQFGKWPSKQSWNKIYIEKEVDTKAKIFQQNLFNKFFQVFPIKKPKVSEDDKPWCTEKLKVLDRQKKREFVKHQKWSKWKKLDRIYREE